MSMNVLNQVASYPDSEVEIVFEYFRMRIST